jgi:hypothetical protein
MSERSKSAATIEGQSYWENRVLVPFIQNAIDQGIKDDDEALLMYWAGFLSSFLGAMCASVGFPASKALLSALQDQILNDAEERITHGVN